MNKTEKMLLYDCISSRTTMKETRRPRRRYNSRMALQALMHKIQC